MPAAAEKTIRLARLSVAGEIEVLDDVENDARALHDLLGGYMEPFRLPNRLYRRSLVGLADEDGSRKELPYNPFSPLLGTSIVGPALIVRSDVPEFASLTEADLAHVREWFGRLLVLPL